MIDLRSDTVTRPTEAMLTAMGRAEVGDDVYGEDPTCRALEERVAGLLGHEAALFTVTGSMANLLGVRALAPAGTDVLCESSAHIARAELGAHATFFGITTRTWSNPRGHLDIDEIARLASPHLPHIVGTAAVSVENTHNFAGGVVQPVEELHRLRELADPLGVAVHMDGARLWNAHVGTGVPLETYGRVADTVCVCLSKGLGAPVGSLVAGSADMIAEARVWRKRLGGGWRQAGVLAAAGLHALDNHIERLADDHRRASMLAQAVGVDPATVDTNIVTWDVADAATFVSRCRDEGVLVGALGARRVRLLTHLDVTDDDCERAAKVLAAISRDQGLSQSEVRSQSLMTAM